MIMGYLLQSGEFSIGRYRIRFARFSKGSWRTQGDWMRLIVTNRRLILLPDEVKQENTFPMVISASNIAQVWSMGLGKRDGGVLELNGGELLYFFVELSQSNRLMRDIRTLLRPAKPAPAKAGAGQKRYVN
jgi:hypothetical protein